MQGTLQTTTRPAAFDPLTKAWRAFALVAYAGYMAFGRGAQVIDVLQLVSPSGPPPPNRDKYLNAERLRATGWATPACLEAVAAYHPELQIVTIARLLNGELRIDTLTAEPWPVVLYAEMVRNATRAQWQRAAARFRG